MIPPIFAVFILPVIHHDASRSGSDTPSPGPDRAKLQTTMVRHAIPSEPAPRGNTQGTWQGTGGLGVA